MQSLTKAIAVSLLTAAVAAQTNVVIPAGYDVAEGNSNNSFPWGYATTTYASMRHQQVYDSANFTGQSIASPIVITGMKLRENGGGLHPGGVIHSNVIIQMSSATVDHTAVSTATAWAGHHGGDLTTVFTGNVTTMASAGTTPNNWIIDVTFTTPFLYDPSAGNDLVIDVERPLSAGTSFFLDNVGSGSSPSAQGSRVYGYPAPGGITVDYALVCELTYSPAVGFAYSSSYGSGCTDRASASFYELFGNGTFDLSNTSWQLIPTGNGYALLPAAPAWFTPASALTLADDSVSPAMPLGFTLNYPGGSTTDVYISSNGFIWAQSSTNNGCCNGVPAGLLGTGARWCPMWGDLNPAVGGTVYFDTDPANGAAYVTFDQVPEYGTTNLNSYQVAFFSTGQVEIRFGACSVMNHQVLTGWSPGANNQDPGSIDISATTILVTEPDLVAIRHSASARPVLGTSINLETTNVPTGGVIGATLFGLTEINPGLSLASVGMPGCFQYTSIDASRVWIPAGGVGTTAFTLPTNTAFAGIEIKTQGAALVPGINTTGALTTNGVKHVLDVN